jgi:hypothetical protein
MFDSDVLRTDAVETTPTGSALAYLRPTHSLFTQRRNGVPTTWRVSKNPNDVADGMNRGERICLRDPFDNEANESTLRRDECTDESTRQ